MNKIVLGTAQFGMDYGINNSRGKIHKNEVFKILSELPKFNIDTLDTAACYGSSQEIIGSFCKSKKNKFKIITKFYDQAEIDFKYSLSLTLKQLNRDNLYGALIHDFNVYKKNNKIWDILEENKKRGVILNTGFSLYYPSELDYLFRKKIKIDIIQIPLNIFDQRFIEYLPELKKRKISIYSRSVFLQGLFFQNTFKMDSYFNPIKKRIIELNNISIDTKIPLNAICLNFVLKNKFIDKVIIGIDGINHLKEIARAEKYSNKIKPLMDRISSLRVNNQKYILPFNWNNN